MKAPQSSSGSAGRRPAQKSTQVGYRLLGAAAALVLGLYGGCSASSTPAPATLGEPIAEASTGDWNDIEAAVLVGVSQAEMAVVSSAEQGPNQRVYVLTTVREEPARLVISRGGSSEAGGASAVVVSASVGRFGDPEREQLLIDAVLRRLKALEGVDYAPLADD